MMVSVTYDDSDVAKALEKIVKDPNAKEFVKLLTPMICSNSSAVDYFFKLMLGNKLPEVIPNGTLCKVRVDRLGYGSNKEGIRERFADDEDGERNLPFSLFSYILLNIICLNYQCLYK